MVRLLLLLVLVGSGCNDHGKRPAGTADAGKSDADPCDACAPGTLCVQTFDGTCERFTGCVTPTVECPQNACSAACQTAYCSPPTQCMTRIPCSNAPASPKAFTCFGP